MSKVVPIQRRPSPKDIAVLVDRMGACQAILRDPKVREAGEALDQCRRQLLAWFPDAEPHAPITCDGIEYTAMFSPCQSERRLKSLHKLMQRIGRAAFFEHVRFPLAAVDQFIPPVEQGEFVTTDHTGPRKLTIVPKLDAKAG